MHRFQQFPKFLDASAPFWIQRTDVRDLYPEVSRIHFFAAPKEGKYIVAPAGGAHEINSQGDGERRLGGQFFRTIQNRQCFVIGCPHRLELRFAGVPRKFSAAFRMTDSVKIFGGSQMGGKRSGILFHPFPMQGLQCGAGLTEHSKPAFDRVIIQFALFVAPYQPAEVGFQIDEAAIQQRVFPFPNLHLLRVESSCIQAVILCACGKPGTCG